MEEKIPLYDERQFARAFQQMGAQFTEIRRAVAIPKTHEEVQKSVKHPQEYFDPIDSIVTYSQGGLRKESKKSPNRICILWRGKNNLDAEDLIIYENVSKRSYIEVVDRNCLESHCVVHGLKLGGDVEFSG